MLLLQITLMVLVSVWAQPDSKRVTDIFTDYIHSVAKGKFPASKMTQDFSGFAKDDQQIFAPCATETCNVETEVKSMSHDKSLWMVHAKVTHGKSSIASRQGCYFVKKDKGQFFLHIYIEDCDGR